MRPVPSRNQKRARSSLPGAAARAAWNHGCWSLQWLGTMSIRTRMPRAAGVGDEPSNVARSPYVGVDVEVVGDVVAVVRCGDG